MTGFKSKRAAALDEDGMYLVHKTASVPFSLSAESLPPPSLTFIGGNSEWVMRITADRRIEVNEGVEVTEAAKRVLEALQHLLPPQPAQEPQRPWVDLTDNQIEQIYYDLVKIHRGAPMPWGQINFGKVLQAAIREANK